MSTEHLKDAPKTPNGDSGDVRTTVHTILDEIESGGDDAALRFTEAQTATIDDIGLEKHFPEESFDLRPAD